MLQVQKDSISIVIIIIINPTYISIELSQEKGAMPWTILPLQSSSSSASLLLKRSGCCLHSPTDSPHFASASAQKLT